MPILLMKLENKGITLDITPRISPNGYATLNLTPSYTALKEQQVKDGQNLIA
ncbi:MAG: type II and III secretion system protein [Ignavibacteriales bacterium]|nr:type II and III secretion system protein [Ignavibacteriales bacterium]